MRILAIAWLILAPLMACAGEHGLRFDSPGVLDLSQREPLAHGKVLPATTLDADVAQQIIAAPTLDQDKATLPFSDYLFRCAADSKTCVPEHERQLIAESAGAVQRDKKRLTLKPADAPALAFVDWSDPTTKTADGDGEKHWYLGTLPKNGFYQIEVQFEQDAPGSFLVNPRSGKTAFVHSGSDIVSLSPDGAHLLTFDPDNPPLTLRIAALDDNGPRLELECTARDDGRSTVQFKGWRDADSVDIAIVSRAPRSRLAHATAVRLHRAADGWQLLTDHADQLASADFSCRSNQAVVSMRSTR